MGSSPVAVTYTFSNLLSVHSIDYLRKKRSFLPKKKMVNRINEWCHYNVLVRQEFFVQTTLSIFFYAKQFNSGCNEKLGMNKLPCKELTLSLFLQISPPLRPLSLSHSETESQENN